VGAAASCSGRGAGGGTSGPATVSIAYSSTQEFNENKQAAEWFSTLKSTFEKQHPGVTVNLIPIGGSYDDFVNKINLMLRSPSTTPDVIHENSQAVGDQVAAGQVAPLDSYLKSWPDWKFFPKVVRLGGVTGPHTYQMISGMWEFGLYYNINQLRKAGVAVPWQPHSWNDILTAAEKVKAKVPGTIPLWIYAGNKLFDQTTSENFLPLLQGTMSPVTQAGKWVVSSKGLRDTFGFYYKVFSGGLGPSTSDLSNPSADGTVNGTLMPHQKVAIALVGSWDGSWWVPGGSPYWPKASKIYKVAILPTEYGQKPGYATQAQGSTFVLTCASRHRILAADLMKLAESKKFNLLHVLWTGEVPPRTDLLTNKRYLNSVPYYNSAEAPWAKYAVFTQAYEYDPYATCMGSTTGEIASSHLKPEQAVATFDSCVDHAMPSSARTSVQ
jgi:multiple sugar transport system substrate-binding protein